MISHISSIILCDVYKMTISAARLAHFQYHQAHRASSWPARARSRTNFDICSAGTPRSNLVLLLQGTIYCRKHLLPSEEAIHHKEHLFPYKAVPHEVVVVHVAREEVLALLYTTRKILLAACSMRRMPVSQSAAMSHVDSLRSRP